MAPRKQDQERLERDFEMFLRDVEEDEDLRQGLKLYKEQRKDDEMTVDEGSEAGSQDDEERKLRIPMEQLLDEFEEMDVNDPGQGAA